MPGSDHEDLKNTPATDPKPDPNLETGPGPSGPNTIRVQVGMVKPPHLTENTGAPDLATMLRQQYGEVVKLEGSDMVGAWWISRPTRKAYTEHRRDLQRKDAATRSNERLVRALTVYPPEPELDALLDEFPLVVDTLADQIYEVMSGGTETEYVPRNGEFEGVPIEVLDGLLEGRKRVYVLRQNGISAVIQQPHKGHADKFRRDSQRSSPERMNDLLFDLLEYPSREEMEALREKYPMITDILGVQASEVLEGGTVALERAYPLASRKTSQG